MGLHKTNRLTAQILCTFHKPISGNVSKTYPSMKVTVAVLAILVIEVEELATSEAITATTASNMLDDELGTAILHSISKFPDFDYL